MYTDTRTCTVVVFDNDDIVTGSNGLIYNIYTINQFLHNGCLRRYLMNDSVALLLYESIYIYNQKNSVMD